VCLAWTVKANACLLLNDGITGYVKPDQSVLWSRSLGKRVVPGFLEHIEVKGHVRTDHGFKFDAVVATSMVITQANFLYMVVTQSVPGLIRHDRLLDVIAKYHVNHTVRNEDLFQMIFSPHSCP
jgi:hypothetical protein